MINNIVNNNCVYKKDETICNNSLLNSGFLKKKKKIEIQTNE